MDDFHLFFSRTMEGPWQRKRLSESQPVIVFIAVFPPMPCLFWPTNILLILLSKSPLTSSQVIDIFVF